MAGKGSNRLNGKRIIDLPVRRDASKSEVETPEYMRAQRLPEKKIKELQEKLAKWKKDHQGEYDRVFGPGYRVRFTGKTD